ncbi:AraC family transcriptional regulator, cel operon repressor [Paenibacillus sp. 1_12]|uniref:AraC family transcriptional regulator n=1 Tax=Paenibacillus sp. 1_12 TaxID=1566278 RepID=UPI0008E1513F|nr:AraC family transcriptional regulator [Paenibacillus sp. 1_12]SFL65633.1 AraC family transcriptional regulator, cel operon repressor [Paenibacillus sp. 1_12]
MKRLLAASIIDPHIGYHYAYYQTMKLTTEEHCHDFYEFFVTFEDIVFHWVNGKKQSLRAGSLVLIRPEDRHYYEINHTGNLQLMNVAFTAEIFEALMNYLDNPSLSAFIVDSDRPPTAHLNRLEQNALKARLLKLALSAKSNPSINQFEFKSLLLDICVQYIYTCMPIPASPIPGWLLDLKDNMQQRENLMLGLPKLYELSCRSPEHVGRSIKKHFGQTATEWINGFKLQVAANLLQYTDGEIVDIASAAGFDNLSHFYHVFKRTYLLSPAKFRNAHTKIIIPER